VKRVSEILSRLMSALLCGLIHFYRYSFASIFGGQCRFEPSCSCYALEAIAAKGPLKGGVLSCKRILRCHPWGGSGYDPVPGAARRTPFGKAR
jgi:putative membrane protein insertion efficiency factor